MNCVFDARHYDLEPSAVLQAIEETLNEMEPLRQRIYEEEKRAMAVFKVWFFRDDVQVQVIDWEDGTMLYIRSASRIGKSDLGVNGRRIEHFFEGLEAILSGLEVGG